MTPTFMDGISGWWTAGGLFGSTGRPCDVAAGASGHVLFFSTDCHSSVFGEAVRGFAGHPLASLGFLVPLIAIAVFAVRVK